MAVAPHGASLMDLLGGVGYALDTPGSLLRGLLAGRGGERVSGRELLELDDDGGGLGLLAEIGLDPLNLIFGGGLAKAALPLAAMSRADKAMDAARAGGTLEEILSNNKLVDELLEAGVMPRELGEKTLFSKEVFRPKAGVDPEEILQAYKGIVPDEVLEQYRPVGGGGGLEDEHIIRLIQDQLSEPVHAARHGDVGLGLKHGELESMQYAPIESLENDLSQLMDAVMGGDMHALKEASREARAGGGSGVTPIRLSPESAPLMELFESAREVRPAQHMTSREDLERFTDLLTAGSKVGHDLDVVSGGPWGGRGVYIAPEGNTAAYLEEGRHQLTGTAYTENPLVIPSDKYYGPHAIQDFMRTNRELFPNVTERQHALMRTPTEGKISETGIGLSDVQDAEEMMKVETYAAAKQEATADAKYFLAEIAGNDTMEGALIDFVKSEGISVDDLVKSYGEEVAVGVMGGEDAISFESFLANTMDEAGVGAEGFSFDDALLNPYSDVLDEMKLDFHKDELAKSDIIKHIQGVEDSAFSPDIASEVARRQGYDSVVFTEKSFGEKNWMDRLFDSAEYGEFRGAVLEDPDFWLEVNMLYPETAKRYHGAAGFGAERTGEIGHGQLFNIADEHLVVPERIPVPKSVVPTKDAAKVILATIGAEGFMRALKSYSSNRESAA